MGSKWFTGGVAVAPRGRIQFDFVISINKARVHGVDRRKTGEDRRVQLCPRALSVLKRHLRLRSRLKAAGKIDHDHATAAWMRDWDPECR